MSNLLASVAVVLAVVLAGCGVPAISSVSVGPGIDVPAEELRPVDRCILDAGFRATAVHPGRFGSIGGHSWETQTWYSWEPAGATATVAAAAICRDRFAPVREWTVEELRELYERWVLEWQCLIGLGYRPESPPSFEQFRSDWHGRGVGPWMPIGIDQHDLTGSRFFEARKRCGLEMLDN